MKKTKLLLIFFTICLKAWAQTPSYVPTTNLVGYWPLHNNLIDSSINAYDGVGSDYTYTVDRFGTANNACDFTRPYSYIQFSNTPINTNGKYSLNYWMKLKSYNDFDVLFDFHPSNICGDYPQIWEQYDSLYIVKCNTVASRVPIGHKSDFLNKWKMITRVVQSDSTFIYIDGKLLSKFPLYLGNIFNC